MASTKHDEFPAGAARRDSDSGALLGTLPGPSSITGRAIDDVLWGQRVRIKFLVEETGKLNGKFDVWMDIDPEAARGLARTLEQLATEAEGHAR